MEDPKDVRIRELEAEVRRLKELVAELLGRLSKNSSNSSKPPSSDIVSPPKQSDKNRKKPKKKQGAQKGHERNLRADFTPDQIDDRHTTTLSHCPNCGGRLLAQEKSDKISYQIELVEKPYRVTEYRQQAYHCECCGKTSRAPLPEGVVPGLFGPKLKALTAWMKGKGRLSFQTTRQFLSTMLHIDVSTGYIANVVREVSDSLAAPFEDFAAIVRNSVHLHCDETGLKKNGKKYWVWVFRSNNATVFKVTSSRGSQVLFDFLGIDFAGTISCDFYGAYRKFMDNSQAVLQFCWAHLIREFLFIAGKAERKTALFGKRIVQKIREMFSVIHQRDKLDGSEWRRRMNFQKLRLMQSLQWGVPDDKDAKNLVERLLSRETEYFRFIEEPIPPTNNPAEQTIRKVTIARKISLGTQSVWGARWLERFWSVETTCEQRGLNLLEFITQTFVNYLQGTATPTAVIS